MGKRGQMTIAERNALIADLLDNFAEHYSEKVKNINTRYFNELDKKIQREIEYQINSYYAYDTEYHRKYSLLDVCDYKMDRKNRTLRLDFSSSKIEQKHPGVGDYIYEWMFGGGFENPSDIHGGWHGGAISGEYHPDPGTPWLRSPIDVEGDCWLREASRTESPYIAIITGVQEVINEVHNKYQKEHDSYVEKTFGEVKRQLRILVYGGDK